MKYTFYPVYEELWSERSDTRVRGGGFVGGDYYDTNALAALFSSIASHEEFLTTLQEVNGFFAVVHPIGDELLIATDRIRSIPLFYASSENGVIVGTDSHRITEHVGCQEYDPLHEAEYILTGYVTGRDTLCDGIYQVQAGELVALTDDAVNPVVRERYYRYRHTQVQQATENELLEELDDVLVSAFTRLIEYADGRPIVVSMSGGYDSRLLISMLVRLGYENLIAFTYDHAGDEAKHCQPIVDNLGIRWEYVRQNHDEWWEWYHSAERKRHDRAAGIIDAVPTNGPAIAVKKLHEQGRVPDNSVFVTGDTATTTGEHIPASLMNATEAGLEPFVNSILTSHYDLWDRDPSLKQQLRERIHDATDIEDFETSEDVIDAFELWDWQERQPKHILRNDLFEFWGYDWWYPLWDRDFMEFWTTVAVDHRYERELYETYIKRLYANVADLPMSEVEESFHERNQWVSRIERTLTGTPLKEPAEQIYRQYISPREYQDNPIWGIMQENQFDEVQSGRQVIHAFRVLDVLDRISFNPRDDGEIPKDGIVNRSILQQSRRGDVVTTICDSYDTDE